MHSTHTAAIDIANYGYNDFPKLLGIASHTQVDRDSYYIHADMCSDN